MMAMGFIAIVQSGLIASGAHWPPTASRATKIPHESSALGGGLGHESGPYQAQAPSEKKVRQRFRFFRPRSRESLSPRPNIHLGVASLADVGYNGLLDIRPLCGADLEMTG